MYDDVSYLTSSGGSDNAEQTHADFNINRLTTADHNTAVDRRFKWTAAVIIFYEINGRNACWWSENKAKKNHTCFKWN